MLYFSVVGIVILLPMFASDVIAGSQRKPAYEDVSGLDRSYVEFVQLLDSRPQTPAPQSSGWIITQ
jgi:hypothetical protein